MDPNACLVSLDSALRRQDRAAVAECADALIGWLEKGGYLPNATGHWWHDMTRHMLLCHLRDLRHVAEMP